MALLYGEPTTTTAIPQVTPQNLVEVANAVKELLELWKGARGDGLDRVITVRDLLNGEVIEPSTAADIYESVGQVPPIGVGGRPVDSATPPTPTNLAAIGGVGTMVLSWDFPIEYTRLAYFEVWRASTNALGSAVLVAQPFANVYADEVDVADTNYYWVRAVSDAGVSPFNAVAGTLGQTAPAFEELGAGTSNGVPYPAGIYLRDIYVRNGIIVEAHIGNAEISTAKIRDAAITTAKILDAAITTAKINDLAVTTAKINDLAVNTAKIADLAVTNAKINDLNAAKITAGFLDAARIQAGSIDATKLTVSQLSAIAADLGTITAGLIRNSTDSVRMDFNATGSSLVFRAGPLTNYGAYAGNHYPWEIYADGLGFAGRGLVSGGTVKASGSYAIPDINRPAVIFEAAPVDEPGGL